MPPGQRDSLYTVLGRGAAPLVGIIELILTAGVGEVRHCVGGEVDVAWGGDAAAAGG